MYESFFSFSEKPFTLAPNPHFLFLSETHKEVYAHLIYGIENRVGFVEITGEVGTGKTTMLYTLLSRLDDKRYRLVFIFNPKLTAFELLQLINQKFGIADDGASNAELIKVLNEFLLSENKSGRIPILFIDEAQNLSGEVLEQIRLISNLETESEKLIQIILVGQTELRDHLNDYSLRQLNQRIAVRYQLRSLNHEETSAYIRHRLSLAGRPDGKLFSQGALSKVYQFSGGIPRRINLICDRALLTAFAEERSVVTARDVKQAVAELAGRGEGRQAPRRMPLALLAAVLLALLVVGAYLWTTDFGDLAILDAASPVTVQTESAVQPGAANQVVQSGSAGQDNVSARTNVASSPDVAVLTPAPVQPNSAITSCNAIFRLWDAPLLNDVQSSDRLDLDREFAARGFELVRMAGRFEDLSRFNVPLLMPLKEEQGGGYLAVLDRTSPDRWSVSPPYQGRDELTEAELDNLGIDMAFVPWIDFASIGYVAVSGERGENVRRLQFLLGLTGCTEIKASGRYDETSVNCVKDFQREHGLMVDGLAGPRTLILLYQAAGAYKMPRLS